MHCGRSYAPATEDGRGDPEFINVIPLEQYLAKYTFFTDPTYPETNLVLIREAQNGTFADVEVDCAGTISGWQDLDAAGTVQYARLDMVTGNFEPVHGCDNGIHTATSAQPFGLVVWCAYRNSRYRRRSYTSSSPSVSWSRVSTCTIPSRWITPSDAKCQGNVVAWTAAMPACASAHSTHARVASIA